MSVATVPEEPSKHFNNSKQNISRRRSLFPSDNTDSESDSDLGHISPLNFDSSFDQEDFKVLTSKQGQKASGKLCDETIGDYDIIGVVENQHVVSCIPQGKYSQSEIMSPLYLSPYFKKSMDTVIAETPSKISPSFKLKTPHDAPNTNSKLPKLSRKSLLDTSETSSNSNKRKLPPDNSPEQNKHFKLDPKSSRVRTTLFPEVSFALSTKSFYPKSEDIIEKIMNKKDTEQKSSILFSSNRKPRPRKKIGQINAGVGHKIRKPKSKKFNKTTLVKATLGAMESTAITDYIMDLKELRSSEPSKLIENKENIIQKQQITPILISEETTVPVDSKKRQLSPDSEPDHNKKFFKFSRAKGVVKMNKNIQLQVDHGKMSLLNKNKSKKDFDMSDLVEDADLPETDISNIISCLEDEIPQQNQIVLQAHNSVVASDNSILLHQPLCTADLILSPISQMCDVTSGLALNTPKKIKNLTPILEEITDGEKTNEEQKMFPVFYPGHAGTPVKKDKNLTNTEKKFKKLSESQTLIDAGQKRFGVTQCFECNFVYQMGDPTDEKMHLNYHSARNILRFPGWKNERIVADFQNDGRIIHIIPTDSKIWWKKANELMDVINQELGCFDMEFSLYNCQVFLYIKNRTIVGCLVATPKSEGCQILTPLKSNIDVCSNHTYPIKCGVARIWVSANNRQRGIATHMMNVLKKNFIMGYTMTNSDIAFSAPTDLGKKFGQKYFKTDHFYIYNI